MQIPEDGAQSFPSNRYALEIINMKQNVSTESEQICRKHRVPLTVFCDESDCQEQLCPHCVHQTTKHAGHKIKQIPDKAGEIKDELQEIKEKTDKSTDNLNKQLTKLKAITNEINDATFKALDKIEERRMDVKEELEKTLEDVDKEAERYKEEVMGIQHSQLRSIGETCNSLKKRKGDLLECIKLIKQFVEGKNSHDIIANNDIIKQLHAEATGNSKDYETWMKSYEIVSFVTGDQPSLEKHPIGTIVRKHNGIAYRDIGVTSVTGSPVSVNLSNSFKAEGHIVTSSPLGVIYIAQLSGDKIQAFDINDDCKSEHHATGIIKGMICFHANNRDKLVIALADKIELRDGESGILLDTLTIPDFTPYKGICQESCDKILISGKEGEQSKVISCHINDDKITKTDKNIDIPLMRVHCLSTAFNANNRKVLFALSYHDKSILALDYESGAKLWELMQSTFHGQIVPDGLCSDNGTNLFVADRNGRRVLVVDIDGRIQRELITGVFTNCWGVSCIQAIQKLIVTDGSYPNFKVYVYDIKYDNF